MWPRCALLLPTALVLLVSTGAESESSVTARGVGQASPADAALQQAEKTLPQSIIPHVPPAAHRTALVVSGVNPAFSLHLAVAGGRDINGDGYSDFALGEAAYLGKVSVFYGGPSADASPDWILSGIATDDEFGSSVALVKDFEGQSNVVSRRAAVLVGAPGRSSDTGSAYLYSQGYCGTVTLGVYNLQAGDRFGESVADAGDCNGDGMDEVIVGASGGGRAYWFQRLVNSPPDDPCQVAWERTAAGSGGTSVAGVSDVNGDGLDDVVVDGKVFLGPPETDWAPDVVLAHAGVGAGAGDMNADGYADIVVGASGRAYVYFGGPTVDPQPGLTLGPELGGAFGCSVAGVGDVNRDGYADIAVGAYLTRVGGLGSGRVYVYYGGSPPDARPDAVFDGMSDDLLGVSVARAGDTFADGFDDVLGAGCFFGPGFVNVYDFKRYLVRAPAAGETWNVGTTKTISWFGAELADVSMSVDGGATFDVLQTAVGGDETNAVAIRVPHVPTRFARIQISPADPGVVGDGKSDSLFTIQASIALLSFQVQAANGGTSALIAWSTEPGPEELAGYRLEKSLNGVSWSTLIGETRQTSYTDAEAAVDARYRLTAINGLGEEYVLGETRLASSAPLVAWPLPYRGGDLHISFATNGLFGQGASAEVAIYDASGRRVRTVAQGRYGIGVETVVWDGRDQRGAEVASGVYFLRAITAGQTTHLKLVVLR